MYHFSGNLRPNGGTCTQKSFWTDTCPRGLLAATVTTKDPAERQTRICWLNTHMRNGSEGWIPTFCVSVSDSGNSRFSNAIQWAFTRPGKITSVSQIKMEHHLCASIGSVTQKRKQVREIERLHRLGLRIGRKSALGLEVNDFCPVGIKGSTGNFLPSVEAGV